MNLPSWVPDWSSRINTLCDARTNWSACGWISVQAAILDDNRLRLTGIECAQTTEVHRHEGDVARSEEEMVRILRKLRPYVEFEEDDMVAKGKRVQRLLICLAGNSFSEDSTI